MFKILFSPGIHLISKISIAKKFIVIFVLYLIPVTYVAYYAINKHAVSLDATKQEIRKIELIKSFQPVFTNMAKTRGLTNAYLNGNLTVKSKITEVVSKSNNQISQISSSSEYDRLPSMEKSDFEAIVNDWQQLVLNSQTMKSDESFAAYSDLINRTGLLMSSIMESSSLFTDPQHQTAFLIKMVVQDLPALANIAGKVRGIGAGVATKGSFDSGTFIALSNNNKQLEQQRSQMAHNFQAAASYGKDLNALSNRFVQVNQAVSEFINMTSSKILKANDIAIAGDRFFSHGTDIIESLLTLYDETHSALSSLIQTRENEIRSEILLNISSSILLVLAAMYLFASVYSNMLDSISRIENCVNAVADGNLTLSVNVNSEDEMKTIGNDINTMVENTKSLVQEVLLSTTELVNNASENRASANTTNSQIEQQNIEVEQVATAMNQMSATVREVASNAEETAVSTNQADKESKAGLAIVQQTIQSINELAKELSNASGSINELQEDVKSIGSVLDVIQGIADQTNLLALNAAIEAARAGESGRGFAVVADEVRTLASKTQESTEEIRKMIDKLQSSASSSVSAINSGNKKSEQTVINATEAGNALQKISESVAHISLMGEQIASAATEQTTVAEEINKSVMQVKDISESTGEAAKKSAQNSNSLNEVANKLQSLVSKFSV